MNFIVQSNGNSSRKRKKLQETTDDDTPLQTKHDKLQMSLEVLPMMIN